MNPAAPVKAPDRTRLAPPLHHFGPFLGDVVLREALQRAHELAVDDSRRERVEVAGDRRHSHVVEQRQAFSHVAVQDQQACFCDPSDRTRRRVAPRADLDRAPGPRASTGQVARQHPLVGADRRKPRLRGILILPVEQSLRACQPAPHRCHQRGVEQQVHRDPDRRRCRRDLIACPHAGRVGTLVRLDRHIEVSGRVGHLAKKRLARRGRRNHPRPPSSGGRRLPASRPAPPRRARSRTTASPPSSLIAAPA